jgi:DNA-binding MarR family transcriptional regulator
LSIATTRAVTISDIEQLINELVRLKRMIHRIGQRSPEAARQRSASWLLFAIRARGPIRLADLATACYIDASTASRQTAELVADGLLRRDSDPTDGRVSLLALTDEGERAVREMLRRREEFFTAALSDWTDDDVRRLAELMGRLTDAIDEQAERRALDPPPTDDARKVPT